MPRTGSLLPTLLLLCVACASHEERAARRLEERGVEPTSSTFMAALRRGELDTLRQLIDAGVRPANAVPRAVRFGHCELLDDLVALGFEATGIDGAEALMRALHRHDSDCVTHLEKLGADLYTQTYLGENLLTRAASNERSSQRIDMVLSIGFDVDRANRSGETALLLAARGENRELVERLLAAGADPDLADLDGWTPLFFAARSGDLRIVRQLLAAGADPDIVSSTGWTALHWAARGGHAAVVDELLRAGADAEPLSSAALTPLIQAASRNATDVVDLLLAAGADPAVEAGGINAAAAAEAAGHAELAVRLQSGQGRTP